jgi:hypothetical protein
VDLSAQGLGLGVPSQWLRLVALAPVHAAPATTSLLSVTVFDDRGEPAPHVMVALDRERGGHEYSTATDEHGVANFPAMPSGWWEVFAGGQSEGLARERLFVEAPLPLTWNAYLDRGLRISGRVVDHDGQATNGLSVLFESTPTTLARNSQVRISSETRAGEELSELGDVQAPLPGAVRTPWVDMAVVREDGSFELSNLPAGLGRLMVVPGIDTAGAALIIAEGVLPGGQEIVLQLPAKPARLQIRATLPPEWQYQHLELRVIHESSGRGTCMTQEEGLWLSQALASGWYTVEADAGPLGWHELGRHFVGEGENVVLPDFAPPPPVRVRVLGPRAAQGETMAALGLTIDQRRSDIDVRGLIEGLSGARPLELPAGDYWAFWTMPDGTKRRRGFTLASGVEFELDLRD